jgi:cation:H+ antiporter
MAVDLIVWIIVFIASMALLIKSSDWFTEAAERVGMAMGLPSFLIGVTIVALGTSLPELASSVMAVLSGASEIVAANVLGSNIFNILVVLGAAAIIGKEIVVSWDTMHIDMPFLIGSTIIFAVTVMDGVFGLFDAVICLAGIAVYLLFTESERKNHLTEMIEKKIARPELKVKTMLILAGSIVLVYIGARYLIESVIAISGIIGVGTEIIAVTAVALGTSLPELAVSAIAAKKGKAEMAVGNVLGSNIFNLFLIMGAAGLAGAIVVPQMMLSLGIPLLIGATVMYYFVTHDKEITKWEGWLLVIMYALFFSVFIGL